MIWKPILFLSLAGLYSAAPVQPQTFGAASTVDDLVQRAMERNREVLALRQRVAEARGLLQQAGMRPTPTLEISGSTGRPLGTRGEEEYAAGYFYPFETFGKRKKRTRIARKSVELAEAELAERTRQLALEIKTRYVQAMAGRLKLEALDRLMAVNRDSYRLFAARVQQGDAAPLELQLLLVELSRTEAQRSAISGHAQADLLELRRLLGLGPSDLTLGEGPVLAEPGYSLVQLQQRALASRPDLRIARVLEEQGAAEVELAEAQARPDVTVSARFSRRATEFENTFGLTASGAPVFLRDRDNIAALGVAIPLLTRRRNLGSIQAAAARAASARLRREHLEAVIPLEVEAVWRRWEAARSTLDILQRGVVQQSEKNLAVIRQAYGLGQLRMLDVLNEQRRLVDTQMACIDAKAELGRTLAELERVAGGGLR